MNDCAIPECVEQTRYLCCQEHWSMVPRALQEEIQTSWRHFNNRQRKDRAHWKHRYLVARDAAIAHVRAAISPLREVS